MVLKLINTLVVVPMARYSSIEVLGAEVSKGEGQSVRRLFGMVSCVKNAYIGGWLVAKFVFCHCHQQAVFVWQIM